MASKDLVWPAIKMAKMMDISPGRLRQLAGEGIVPKAGRDSYKPFEVNIAYIRYLRDRAQSPELSDSEFHASKLAKIKSEREMIELEMSILRKQRIPIEDCNEIDNEILQAISGIIKANRNKVLTPELINEIFGTMRAWADKFESVAA